MTVTGGAILVLMGLVPKLGALAEAIPQFVLGGAGVVMFGMVSATGIRILGKVDFSTRRHNLFIVAISIGFGLIPLVVEPGGSSVPGAQHGGCRATVPDRREERSGRLSPTHKGIHWMPPQVASRATAPSPAPRKAR